MSTTPPSAGPHPNGAPDLRTPPATVKDLRRQAGHAAALAEQIDLLSPLITTWATGLPDRLAATSWTTTAITTAAQALADAAAGGDPRDLADHLAQLQAAIAAAAQLGAPVSTVAEAVLTGDTRAHAGRMDGAPTGGGSEPGPCRVHGGDLDGVADLVAQYDIVARSEPWTRQLDRLHQALDRDLRELGVDIDGYLAEVVERARRAWDDGRRSRYLTLTAYLAQHHAQADVEDRQIDDRLAAMLLDNLDRNGHRDAVLAQIRDDQGQGFLDQVLQAAARGRAHRARRSPDRADDA